MRPYDTGYHPFAWRGWWDFGTGALGDMACHTANMAFRACELASPTTIEADATDVNPETFPSSAKIKYTYPARGDKPHQAALDFYWYEGKRNRQEGPAAGGAVGQGPARRARSCPTAGRSSSATRRSCSRRTTTGPSSRSWPANEELAKGDRSPKVLPVNGKGDDGMKEEWARAIREGKPEIAYSNFDIAGMLTEAILLGNVAIRAGKKIEFDAAKLKVHERQGGQPVHQAGVPQGLGTVRPGLIVGMRSQESGVQESVLLYS